MKAGLAVMVDVSIGWRFKNFGALAFLAERCFLGARSSHERRTLPSYILNYRQNKILSKLVLGFFIPLSACQSSYWNSDGAFAFANKCDQIAKNVYKKRILRQFMWPSEKNIAALEKRGIKLESNFIFSFDENGTVEHPYASYGDTHGVFYLSGDVICFVKGESFSLAEMQAIDLARPLDRQKIRL